jgi:lipopolysaccharide biosynthesis protein
MNIKYSLEILKWVNKNQNKFQVSGWVFDEDGCNFNELRIADDKVRGQCVFDVDRYDVKEFHNLVPEQATYGFSCEGTVDEFLSELNLEVQDEQGTWHSFRKIFKNDIKLFEEKDPSWDPVFDNREITWLPNEVNLDEKVLRDLIKIKESAGKDTLVSIIYSTKTKDEVEFETTFDSLIAQIGIDVEVAVVTRGELTARRSAFVDNAIRNYGNVIKFDGTNYCFEENIISNVLEKLNGKIVAYLDDDIPIGSIELLASMGKAGKLPNNKYIEFYQTLDENVSKRFIIVSNNETKKTETVDEILTKANRVKTIAFYLPQFHPIKENNTWWGEGFTEWTNVTRVNPLFTEHYQPHLPADLGFYDLRVPEVQLAQAKLALQYNIYGFCYYHYWFSGKKLLQKPLENLLSNKNIKFPFCVCWANENWSRRWDGRDNENLIEQKYKNGDYKRFIEDLIPVLSDDRYIRVEGKLLLLVYRVELIKNVAKAVAVWRKVAHDHGLGDLHLVGVESFSSDDPEDYGFDAMVEFPPACNDGVIRVYPDDYKGQVYDYGNLAHTFEKREREKERVYRGVSPAWDNTARRKSEGTLFHGSTPNRFRKWVQKSATNTKQNKILKGNLMFVNAWNEWAEGCHLEPDQKFGHGYLTAVRDGLRLANGFEMENDKDKRKVLFISHDFANAGAQLLLLRYIEWLSEYDVNIELETLFNVYRSRLLHASEAERKIYERFEKVSSCYFIDSDSGTPENLNKINGGHYSIIYANTSTLGELLETLDNGSTPILSHIHELSFWVNYRVGKESFHKQVDKTAKFIACSKSVKDMLADEFNIENRRIETIHASTNVNLPEGKDKEKIRLSIRKQLDLDEKQMLIISCGTFDWRKGCDLFLPLLSKLKSIMKPDSFKAVWLGDYGGSLIMDQFNYEAHRRGLLGYVEMLGPVSNPTDYMQSAECYVLTSREDPFPLVMLEAASACLPIVGFEKSGGFDEFVDEGGAVGVPYLDLDLMAEEIKNISKNKNKYKKIGEKGFETAKKYSHENSFELTYQTMIDNCVKVQS